MQLPLPTIPSSLPPPFDAVQSYLSTPVTICAPLPVEFSPAPAIPSETASTLSATLSIPSKTATDPLETASLPTDTARTPSEAASTMSLRQVELKKGWRFLTVEERLAEKLNNARNALMEKSLYLGIASSLDKLTWIRAGKADILVTNDDAAALGCAHCAGALDGDSSDLASPEPAVLSAVVQIASEDFWMMSCGNWKGPTEIARAFSDVKLSCAGVAPNHEVFASDFPIVINNITSLFKLVSKPNFSQTAMIAKTATSAKLKFRHVLFEVGLRLISVLLFLILHTAAHQRRI
jgi:hypothetical protein